MRMPRSSSTAGEFEAPGRTKAPAINVGAEYRKDSVDFQPDEFAQSGDIAGFTAQVFPIRGSIGTREIFGEARIPLVTDKLVRRLAFEGGFRKSWYENPRSKFSTDAYKLALDLTAVTGLRLRASQQRANRAPERPGTFHAGSGQFLRSRSVRRQHARTLLKRSAL